MVKSNSDAKILWKVKLQNCFYLIIFKMQGNLYEF